MIVIDLHTMTQIMGKTKLRDDYMSYYNELVKLSPMTRVDYDNLTNVMGQMVVSPKNHI